MYYAESWNFLTLEPAKLLANSVVNTQFGCAPLIWMFASKNSMLKVNKIHWRTTLRVVYDDYNSTYEEHLASHSDISIHQKHLKHLTFNYWILKILNELVPRIQVAFLQKQIYSLKFKKWKCLHFTSCTIVPLRYKFSTISR